MRLEIGSIFLILLNHVLDSIKRFGLNLEGIVNFNLTQQQGANNINLHAFSLLSKLSQLRLTRPDPNAAELYNLLNQLLLTLSTNNRMITCHSCHRANPSPDNKPA